MDVPPKAPRNALVVPALAPPDPNRRAMTNAPGCPRQRVHLLFAGSAACPVDPRRETAARNGGGLRYSDDRHHRLRMQDLGHRVGTCAYSCDVGGVNVARELARGCEGRVAVDIPHAGRRVRVRVKTEGDVGCLFAFGCHLSLKASGYRGDICARALRHAITA